MAPRPENDTVNKTRHAKAQQMVLMGWWELLLHYNEDNNRTMLLNIMRNTQNYSLYNVDQKHSVPQSPHSE